MKKHYFIKFIVLFILLNTQYTLKSEAQLPSPALVGYWHNWNIAGAPYIPLDQVDSRYNVIDVSFAEPVFGTDYKMAFNPVIVSQATFITQVQTLQAQGRKVIISVGGANAPVHLTTTAKRDTFINTMTSIINTYGFDGLDIDLEGSSLSLTGGTIANPVDAKIVNLIYATNKIMENYHVANNKKLILTMAPETAFVQGGQSAFGGIWGAYLPFIDAMRDSLDMLHVQLYNSGSMFGIDNAIYTQGTADFIVAMVEAVIVGFSTSGGAFAGIPANKVGVGLPACASAAGGGYTDTNQVIAAVNYLRGLGPKPGSYTLSNATGYFNLGGMMTWSVNWDAATSCNGTYQYANTFQTLFTPLPLSSRYENFSVAKENGRARLLWKVDGLTSAVHSFDVERSANGVDFYSIGNIVVRDQSSSYAKVDPNPVEGVNYYRIRMNTINGKRLYSNVRQIVFSSNDQQIVVYPNPTDGLLHFKGNVSQSVNYSLFDMQGRKLKQIKDVHNGTILDIREYPIGMYYIKSEESAEVFKVFKR